MSRPPTRTVAELKAFLANVPDDLMAEAYEGENNALTVYDHTNPRDVKQVAVFSFWDARGDEPFKPERSTPCPDGVGGVQGCPRDTSGSGEAPGGTRGHGGAPGGTRGHGCPPSATLALATLSPSAGSLAPSHAEGPRFQVVEKVGQRRKKEENHQANENNRTETSTRWVLKHIANRPGNAVGHLIRTCQPTHVTNQPREAKEPAENDHADKRDDAHDAHQTVEARSLLAPVLGSLRGLLIRAHEWLSLSYRAPRISRRVQIRVAASRPVDVWALPEEELASFSSSQDFEYYVRRTRMKLASFTFRPDGGRDWALIVDNLNPTAVSVRYDVIW